MIRGTTPTHTFKFGTLNPEELTQLNAYYAQRGEVILTKTKEDFNFNSFTDEEITTYTAYTKLTQEETLLFSPRTEVEIQIRVLTSDGIAMASPKYKVPVQNVLDDEVLN